MLGCINKNNCFIGIYVKKILILLILIGLIFVSYKCFYPKGNCEFTKNVFNPIFSSINKSIITKKSSLSYKDTIKQIRSNINNKNLKMFDVIDHSKNASSFNLNLRPTSVIVFGNAKIGTILINESPNIAIDLPQKIIVYQDGDDVIIGYKDANEFMSDYDLNHQQFEEISIKINSLMDEITSF